MREPDTYKEPLDPFFQFIWHRSRPWFKVSRCSDGRLRVGRDSSAYLSANVGPKKTAGRIEGGTMSAQRFRKRPVEVEAIQITNETFDAPHPNPDHIPGIVYDPIRRTATITTLEGEMVGNLGDWIIRGVAGEFYPCKPDIFEQTYELAGEATDAQ